MNDKRFIWMNGELQAWDQAQVHVLTHALHYGLGFFEGIRAYKAADCSLVFRLQDHIKRLFNSAKIGGIEIPYSFAELTNACVEVLKVNQLAEGYIRPIVYLGQGPMGVFPSDNPVQVAISAWQWAAYLGKEALEKGIKTRVSTFNRCSPQSILARAKMTGGYAIGVMAKMEAHKLGYHEAILLDSDGYVAEGTGENIFIVSEGQLITPSSMAILPGITRDTIMKLAKEQGLAVIEQRFSRDRLYVTDEAFFTGTAAEVTPIMSVDDRLVGNGAPGPITKRLQELYFQCVYGELKQHQNWLSAYQLNEQVVE